MNNLGCSERNCEIWVKDNLITYATEDFLELTKCSSEEILQKDVKIVGELIRSAFLCENIQNGKLVDEFIFTKDLKPRHVKINMYMWTDKVTKIYCFQRYADAIFENKFPAIEVMIENNVSGVVIYKYPEKKILRANLKGIENGFIDKFSVEQVIGKNYDSIETIIISNTDVAKMTQTLIDRKQPYSDLIHKQKVDGTTKTVNAVVLPVYEENRLKYFITLYKDPEVADENRLRIDNACKASFLNKTNNEKILDFINIPAIKVACPSMEILSIDLKGMNEKFNHEAEGCDVNSFPKEILKKHFTALLLSDDNMKYVNEMIETKCVVETRAVETQLMGKNHIFSYIFKPCLDVNNNIYEFFVFIIDKSNKMAADNAKEELKKSNAEFMSYMAHEFKAPLTVIHSAIQLIDFFCHDELSERSERFINKIRQSAMQQLRLVNNFLDINKIDSGYLKLNKTNVDIVMMTSAIINAVSLICESKNISIMFASSVPSRFVLLDDEKYERILLNILSNAIKFTPKGKCIYVDLSIKHNQVQIKIRDEGAGIPEDKREMIFEKFGQVGSGLTREGEGTGLGLCLAKMLAKAHNGDILLESQVGVGSEFTILLPDISAEDNFNQELAQKVHEDRLIQSVKVEFSNIYM